MVNNIAYDRVPANWPDSWPHENRSLGKRIMRQVTGSLHQNAAHRVLPALNIKAERLSELDEARGVAAARSAGLIQRAHYMTFDKLILDGAIVWANEEDGAKHDYMSRPWILYFNGNSETYEENLPTLQWYSKETGCNVIGFNYRGVGYSQGEPYTASDLTLDGDAVFQFLQRQGVDERNILIHARSLGGAVGTAVRRLHPDGPICSERSFSSWADLEEPFHNKTENYFIRKILNGTGWDFHPVKDWAEIRGRKWIIVSPSDEVIAYQTASFYKAIKNSLNDVEVIKLPKLTSLMRGGAPEGHNVPLKCKVYAESWSKQKEIINSLFKL